MKSAFILITIFINFFNSSYIKSDEKTILNNENSGINKIHIVKEGDTLSSISNSYSVNKKLIIKLNDLKNENYIYVGQNLIIYDSKNNWPNKATLNNQEVDNFHFVQIGENLTEISNKYNVKVEYLISINNLKNPNSIKVGDKILLSKKKASQGKNITKIESQNSYESLNLNKKQYGPIKIQSNKLEVINGRQTLNVLNINNKKLILSIQCETKEIDVRMLGRKWSGWKPAKEDFEKNLINDFC